MGENETEAHAKLLSKENTAADDDDDDEANDEEMVITVQVPQLAAAIPSKLDPSSADSANGKSSGGGGTGGGGGAVKRMSSASLRSNWKLKYQDFLPAKKNSASNWTTLEQFQYLVDAANDWLKSNPDVRVKTCQTLTWMSHDVRTLGNSEQMVLSKSVAENTLTYFVRGLRLWLVPQNGRKTQTLTCHDITPEPIDTIPTLVTKVNKRMEQKQLKGHMITLETINVPILNGKLDSRVTRWTESMNDDTPYAYALRVYLVRDSSSNKTSDNQPAQVGVKDFVPMETADGYEGFEDLVERTNTWLRDQIDVLIVNMQSLMTQSCSDSHVETGSLCFFSMPGINSPNPVDFFRILRVVYVKVQGDQAAHVPIIYPFTYETFTPELVRHRESSCKERMEKMNETFSKVIAFLRNSGADLICSEMVFNPMQLYSAEDDNNPAAIEEIKFLFTIRLYLTGQISRLDGSLRSIKRASIASSKARNSPVGDGPQIHPGPIFLRNVVSRHFPYRWLVLGLSAITCMTVIVVVSVVYANR